MEQNEQDREPDYAALKAKLERGAAQADRGEFIDPDEVLDKIDALIHQREQEKK